MSLKIKLLILLVLLLLTVGAAAAATVTVSAGTVQAQPADTVEIPIQLSGATGLGALHLELTYDATVLTAQDVSRGDLAGSNALLDSNAKQAGRLIIGIVSLDGIKGDGTVAKARFKVIGDAGKSTDLKFQNNQAWDRQTHAEVLVNSQPGKVTIAAWLPSWLIPALLVLLVVILLLIILLIFARRRRPAPQPAYGQSGNSAPAPSVPPVASPIMGSRPATIPGIQTPPPSLGMPEIKTSAPAPSNADVYKKAEDEYFRLKGRLSAGRLTEEQFRAAVKDLMQQDAQGRYWMLGVDTGKWYFHDGQTWIEGQPY